MNRYYLSIVLLLLYAGLARGQTKTAFLMAAEEAYVQSDYYTALSHYLEAYEFDSTDIAVNHGIAESARKFNSYTLAQKHYQKVQDIDSDNNYPEDVFWLADAKHHLGDYEGAKLQYIFYQTEFAGDDPYLSARAEKEIKACEWASELRNNPRPNVKIQRLGDGINTAYSEFAGIREDEGLYFSSLRFDEKEPESLPRKLISKILLTTDDATADTIQGEINKDDLFSAHSTFNKDKTKIFFTLCEYVNGVDIRCDLYESDVTGINQFSAPQKLNESINAEGFTSTQPAYAYNNITGSERVYFVSDREGGEGKLDIWYFSITNGVYSLPMMLPNINTAENDITPYYHSITRTLYFSSEGYRSMGGYDVYKSKESTDSFGEPDHMGVPINSSYNDIYYSVDKDGDQAYFSSNRFGSNYVDDPQEACCYDIYKADIEEVALKLNAKTFVKPELDSLENATVQLYDAETGELIAEVNTANGNDHEFDLEPDRDYMIIGKKENFKSDTIQLSTKDMYTSETISRNLFLEIEQVCLDLDILDRDSKEGLDNATVTITDLTDPNAPDIIVNSADSNRVVVCLDPNKSYRVTIDREGYEPETFIIDENTTSDGGVIKRTIFMDKRDLNIFLPAFLYFDNDRPNRKSYAETTTKSYTDTYNPYIGRKDYFVRRAARNSEEQRMIDFFEFDVKGGYAKLYLFLNELTSKLNEGYSFEILVKGHASPLAPSEYNKRLSKRRIASIRNELSKYNGGILLPFMDSNQLVITDVSYGEEQAPPGINDKPSNQTASVYSVEASRERRVEIIKIRSTRIKK